MRLAFNGLCCLLFDLFRCPVQFFLNLFSSRFFTSPMHSVRDIDFSNSEDLSLGIVIHHYAPYGMSFKKKMSCNVYDVGLGHLLGQVNQCAYPSICYVADGSESYIQSLSRQFERIRFVPITGKYFDFLSYFSGASFFQKKLQPNYIAFFNDNIQENSDLESFIDFSVSALENNKKCALVGRGSNTYLTQSLFKKSFSPHVQTFAWVTRSSFFYEFSKTRSAWLGSAFPNFFLKQLVCRLLEQGYSQWLLSRGNSIIVKQEDIIVNYYRRSRWFDTSVDWLGIHGDSRFKEKNPFQL